MQQAPRLYVQHQVSPADSISQAEPSRVHLNSTSRGPQGFADGWDGLLPGFPGQWGLKTQFPQGQADGVQPQVPRSCLLLGCRPSQHLMKAPIAISGMFQGSLTNSFQVGLLLHFPLGLPSGLLSGVPQLPGGNIGFASEAGQAQVRMVSVELLVDGEKLSRTQRPRTFFAIWSASSFSPTRTFRRSFSRSSSV